MAGSKGSKYWDIFLKYNVWLNHRSGDGEVGDDLIELLKEIDKAESLKSAAENCGMSYRKAWGDIRDAEELLGFTLVQKVRGGKQGGLSRLSPDGQELVQSFNELHQEFDAAIKKITKKFFHKLNKNE